MSGSWDLYWYKKISQNGQATQSSISRLDRYQKHSRGHTADDLVHTLQPFFLWTKPCKPVDLLSLFSGQMTGRISILCPDPTELRDWDEKEFVHSVDSFSFTSFSVVKDELLFRQFLPNNRDLLEQTLRKRFPNHYAVFAFQSVQTL